MEKSSQDKASQDTVEGFALTGEEVYNLNDKTFTIYEKPFYKEVPDYNDKEKMNKKLIIPVQLANGTKADWYANKKCQGVIMAARGRLLSDWVNYKGEFIAKEQVIGKEDKLVIYLK